MVTKRGARIWVDPDFKKQLKMEALRKGTNVIDLTKKLSIDDGDSLFKKDDRKRRFQI